MAVSKTQVNKRVAEALGMSNAASAFGAYDGGTWKTADVDESILSADAMVISGLLWTPGNGHRRAFEAASSTAHGALIADHVGPIGAVTFAITGGLYAGTRSAKLVSKEEVERDNLNPAALTTIPPKYAIEGDRLFHNAAGMVLGGASSITVSVDICTFTLTTACQSPDEAYDAVFHGAMFILAKNGHHNDAAGTYRQAFQQDLLLLGVAPEIAARLSAGIDERSVGAQA